MENVNVCSRPDIIKMVDEHVPKSGEITFWWLGQSGFAVKSGSTVIYLDPYLSTRLERITEDKPQTRHVRMMPSPVDPAVITHASYIVCSHNHGDHLDPESVVPILESSMGAKLIVPPAAVSVLKNLGISDKRVIPVGVGDRAELITFTVEAVPGRHNEFDFNPVTGYPYVGYILNFNGITLYHAGDTVYYEGMEEKLAPYDIDVALLPINGGDTDRVKRGFMSNLQFWEAADLASALSLKLVVPTHFGMFTINTENVERFEYYMDRKYPGLNYVIPRIGEAITLNK